MKRLPDQVDQHGNWPEERRHHVSSPVAYRVLSIPAHLFTVWTGDIHESLCGLATIGVTGEFTIGSAPRMAQPQIDPQSGQRVPMADHTAPWPWQSGGAGLYSTAGDYLRFCQMLLQRGEWEGKHLLAANTVDLMTSDHIPADVTYDEVTSVLFQAEAPTREMGQSFGLGFALRTHAGLNPLPGSVADYYWAGALGTYLRIDPKKELILIFMSQAPELRLHYRSLMRQLVYQALE